MTSTEDAATSERRAAAGLGRDRPFLTWRGPVLVTGTDTGVGKTVVTAAIAASWQATGVRVAVLKPAQTGDDDDAATVARLAAPTTVTTLTRYPDPLAPLTAARIAGLQPLPINTVTQAVRQLARDHDSVLVEGAGGLLVPMGCSAGGTVWTVADLAAVLSAPAVVVVRPDLGTLNHTALTVEALRRRGIECRLVIGSWPASPELVHRTNLRDLATIAPVIGRVPAAAGDLAPNEFRRAAYGWWQAPPE